MRRTLLTAIMIMVLAFSAQAATRPFIADKSGDEVLQALISTKAAKFTVETFSDDVTGLAISYNIFLPEGRSSGARYPTVFFMADGSSAGKKPSFSLTQGCGALVWPDDCIVIVPTYPEMILDDHNGFVKSEYVELTARFVRWAVNHFSIDPSRVYATGQSMGCMTFLVLAAKYTDMFTACLFVSGQWDINELSGLLTQKFIYVASAGDDKASTGQREVIDMFIKNYDGEFSITENVNAKDAEILVHAGQPVSFITFKAGSTLPDPTLKGYSEHMTSFDYAYKIAALREWLLSQRKETN